MAAKNQTNGYVKSQNGPQFPIKMKTRENQEEGMGTRSGT